MSKNINIAIDGHSSTGKSTLARQLAQQLSYRYIDTGAMYRALTLYALDQGLIQNGKVKEEALIRALPEIQLNFKFQTERLRSDIFLNGKNVEEKIRHAQVANWVSQVAVIPEVRAFLVHQQQAMAHDKRVVMDGRDIGTVVLPEAELKIFMTADPEVRAQRRYEELKAKGHSISLSEVAENLKMRDEKDSNRSASPLRRAAGAFLLDNSKMTLEEQLEQALLWVRAVV